MSNMELNIPFRDIENLRVMPSSKSVGLTQSRPILGEIGNKLQMKKDIENIKVKALNTGLSFSKGGSNFSKVIAPGKVDIANKKILPAVKNNKNTSRPKEKVNLPTVSNLSENTADLTLSNPPEKEIKNIDENDQKDIFLLGRYVCDIYKYLLELEVKIPIKSDFLFGTTVTPSMRATLIDWLIDVQIHYSFLLETLHLSVSIIDRFLQNSGVIQRKNFQLVGITAMFLACKFEETYYPEISDFIYMTENAYVKQQVLDLEKEIVKRLDFQLGRPISLTFLRRYSKIVQADQFLHTLGKYFIELALLEFSLAYVRPSKVAAAAVYIALCIKANEVRPDLWTPTLQHYSTYSLQDFQSVTKKLALSIKDVSHSKHKSIRKKYERAEFMCVSNGHHLRPDSSILRRLSLVDCD